MIRPCWCVCTVIEKKREQMFLCVHDDAKKADEFEVVVVVVLVVVITDSQ